MPSSHFTDRTTIPGDLTINDGIAVLTRRGASTATVARVLGEITDPTGRRTVWLDRLIHRSHEQEVGPWHVSGAISSVLTLNSPLLPQEASCPS